MPRKNTKTKKTQKKNAGTMLLVVILVAGLTFGGLALARFLTKKDSHINNESEKNTAELYQPDDTDEIDDANEKATNDASYDRKEAAEKEAESHNQPTQNTDSGKTEAKVVVNFAELRDDKINVGGTVTNLVEQDGKCEYKFTNGDTEISKIVDVLPNARNTPCEAVTLDKSGFSVGKWRVSIKYSSNKAEGESEATTFEVR